jgi:hypothetical protein
MEITVGEQYASSARRTGTSESQDVQWSTKARPWGGHHVPEHQPEQHSLIALDPAGQPSCVLTATTPSTPASSPSCTGNSVLLITRSMSYTRLQVADNG